MSEIWSKYTLTAARSHDPDKVKARRPTSGTLDIHSHVMIEPAAELVKPHLPAAQASAAADTIAVGRKQDADRRSRLTRLAERLADLDAMGIAIQVIKPTPMQCCYNVPPEIGLKAARMINDGLAEYAAQRPERFVGFGTVPLPDGDAAAAELERCMRALHFKGVQILTNVNGRELSDPAFDPFWAKAEALGALVVIHPQGFTAPGRLGRFYFNNVIGNPLDTTIAVHNLIFDGVLERFPNLRILAVHGGAYAAAYSGRMDHAWGARSDSHGALPKPPTHYLRKFYFDTVVFTPHQLENLVRVFGSERILMGTDYPYDMGEYDPVGHVAGVESFDQKTIAAVAGGNARKLLGLA
jgi:aminocarboxymuconate-semialdehyde decarboxylase